jgi:uncharacterized phage protein (TIGR02220 family)
MIVDEFASIWEKADKDEKKLIRAMVEKHYEKPHAKMWNKQADEVLSFLNEKTGRNYRHVDTNLKPIVMLMKTGVSQEQMYAVVAMMCRKWAGDSKMDDYLRPATLFNKTKFESYIGFIGK